MQIEYLPYKIIFMRRVPLLILDLNVFVSNL